MSNFISTVTIILSTGDEPNSAIMKFLSMRLEESTQSIRFPLPELCTTKLFTRKTLCNSLKAHKWAPGVELPEISPSSDCSSRFCLSDKQAGCYLPMDKSSLCRTGKWKTSLLKQQLSLYTHLLLYSTEVQLAYRRCEQ